MPATARPTSSNGRAPLDAEPAVQQLVLAADQFLVERRPAARTVIAGYHWFNDWGRDTMIALPGLTLATGRAEEGAAILRSFAPHVRDGLLPNNFPDSGDADPGYNTVDASLWYVVAIGRHLEATGDDGTPRRAAAGRSARSSIGTSPGRGTGSAMDPADGLLRAGEPGLQLTWMDAKVGDWVVTPRIGKPVEINALWYNALRYLSAWLTGPGRSRRDDLPRPGGPRPCLVPCPLRSRGRRPPGRRRRRARRRRSPPPPEPDLRDLAAVPAARRRCRAARPRFRRAVARDGYGLRTLPPTDPDYRGDYGGDQFQRDSALPPGTGVDVARRGIRRRLTCACTATPPRPARCSRPFEDHLRDAGLGTISEILEGDPPHEPRGCIAQAWGVAEVLRAWRLVDGDAQDR